MFAFVVVMLIVIPNTSFCKQCPRIISRMEWGARMPKSRTNMITPVDTVVIHHTYIPGACHNMSECVQAMKEMQDFHMDNRGWDDIGYSFLVGGDNVYEGRGWSTVGAHAPGFNNHSIGIAFIGDYRVELPTKTMLSNGLSLIRCGIVKYIRSDYQLLGHRQVRDTECPGDAFYKLIQTWCHWSPNPRKNGKTRM